MQCKKWKEDKKVPFIEFLLNPNEWMINEEMRRFVNNAEDSGLDHEPFVLLNRALVDIITKSPPAKDGVLAKLDPLIEKIKLTPLFLPKPRLDGRRGLKNFVDSKNTAPLLYFSTHKKQ